MARSRSIRWVIERRRLGLRFAVGLLLIAGLLYWATPSLAAVGPVDLGGILLAVGFSLAAFGCWFEAFYRTIRTVTPTTRRRMVVPYLGGTFARNVTPAGTLSGVAVGAYLAARWSAASGDRTLGALAVLEVLLMAGSALAAGVGLAVTVLERGGRIDGLADAVTVVAGLLGLVVVALVVLARRPKWIVAGASLAAGLARRAVSWVRPSHTRRFSRSVLQPHIDSVLAASREVAGNRRAAVLNLVAGFVGWVAMGLSLFWSAWAVGVPLEPWAAVAIVPVAGLAGVVPTPGGLGAIDGLLVALLMTVVGGDLAAILTATLIFRAATFWLHLAASGLGSVLAPGRPSPTERPESEAPR